MKAIGYPETGG